MEAQGSVCIVGGGPAGMMAGLLFARAGVPTTVLEKHGDFLRDFRGDTVHPSTLDLFDELGLADRLLARPHDAVATIDAEIGGRRFKIADFSHLPVRHRFVAMMPQWEFLDFVADVARPVPNFTLRMNCAAVGVLENRGRITGVKLADGAAITADLVIAADGRRSIMRGAAKLPLEDLGAPIDVFWFRVPKTRAPRNETTGYFGRGHLGALIDRGDYWQCAWVIAKGGAEAIRAQGIEVFRERVEAILPQLAPGIGTVESWDDVKLLTVSLDRLTRWHAPGLLAIGDAAHAMSPVGGVGINLAIQDAVAAANIIAGPIARGEDADLLLAKVQARRMLPTRVIQGMQKLVHDRIMSGVMASSEPIEPPLAVRLLDRYAPLRRVPARLIGLGFRREHVFSPDASATTHQA